MSAERNEPMTSESARYALTGAERLHDALGTRNDEGRSALIDWLVDNAGDEWWDEVVGLAVEDQLPSANKKTRGPRDVLTDRIERWADDIRVYDYADRLIRDLDDAGFQIVFRTR